MCRAVCYNDHIKVLMFGHDADDCLASNLVDTSSRIINTAFSATNLVCQGRLFGDYPETVQRS